MNPTRRFQVIHLLQRQAQLQREQMADEQANFIEKYNQIASNLEGLNQEQAAAHGYLRKYTSQGAEINPALYRSIALSSVERTSRIETVVSDATAAERDVEEMRLKLYQHEERIEKLEEIAGKEKSLQNQREAIVEFNANDALWLSRRGVQK